MRDALAERLLANVMNWTPEDVARERPILQTLAALKYDEYQQFSPGMRFVESLALWLEQFVDLSERQAAYAFVMSRLVFLSHAEMAHFAAIAYPDFVRPLLINWAAQGVGLAPFRVKQVLATDRFKKLQDATLFFGLSDGARIDLFRRSNRDLSHEQIFTGYELSDEKVDEIYKWLSKRGHEGSVPAIVLLDDFSASGANCLKAEGNKAKGKVAKFLDRIQGSNSWKQLIQFPETKVIIALYVATEQALKSIAAGAAILKQTMKVDISVVPAQTLSDAISIRPDTSDAIVSLIHRYYDASVEDEHTKKGGTDLKYGFSSCGLPLVLHHNTPNNSIFLLWVEGSDSIKPLFPRVSRHRRET